MYKSRKKQENKMDSLSLARFLLCISFLLTWLYGSFQSSQGNDVCEVGNVFILKSRIFRWLYQISILVTCICTIYEGVVYLKTSIDIAGGILMLSMSASLGLCILIPPRSYFWISHLFCFVYLGIILIMDLTTISLIKTIAFSAAIVFLLLEVTLIEKIFCTSL